MKRLPTAIATIVALCAATLALTACSGAAEANQIIVAGSTTVMPIAEVAGEAYEQQTDIPVLVSGLGSSAGIEAVLNGTADIATSSRDLTPDEEASGELVRTVIATDGIAIIVNESNPITNLTHEQLRDISAGTITKLSQVGGRDLHIHVVNRDEASGTREAIK